MAISIINNSTAIGAQSSVNNANNSLTKTLKALSTGLRINSASDDASGLAVSEKLRGQISGLAKAATNSQDAISMLQTAEGAMGSMTSMVQRIRELAVQAGDPAYTSNDRAMLQLEVDQLKEEIDRVSNSTEFNTKKLLNGDAAALWSASTDNIEAVVKGTAVEGNYKLSYDVDPGQNSVYKSNIMRLGEGEMSYDINTNGTSITKFDNIQGMLRGSDMTIKVKGTAATTASAVFTGGTGGMNSAAMTAAGFEAASAAATGANSYSIEFEAVGDRSANGTGQIRFRVMNTKTGELSEWASANVASTGGVAGVTSSNSFSNLAGIASRIFAGSGTATFGTAAWNDGDKMLVNVAAGRAGSTSGATIKVGSTGSTLHITAGATNSATATTHTIYTSQMDKAGNVYYGSMDVTLEKGKIVSGTATIDILGEGDVASKYTKLSQLAQFTNADGRMVLDNTQEISIYGGNGNVAKVILEGSDTIEDLKNKLNSAIIDQLNMGAPNGSSASASVNKNLVQFTENDGTNGASAGSFTIQGAVLGKDSNLTFVGDEGILNALGVTQTQKATDSALTVSVQNANTGAFVGEDTITDGRLRNVIEGVDIDITPSSAADIIFNTASNTMEFKAKSGTNSTFLHITDNATKAAIGANEGQTLDISIGRLDTKSMGINDVNVATFDDAQSSITKLDLALEQISKSRATAGAQINRLEYTITNLNTTRENMIAAESRIRDLDIATASSDLAAQQVLMQSATAMLAQANQIPNYAMTLLA